jgi:Na+/H+ antiporter NhaA
LAVSDDLGAILVIAFLWPRLHNAFIVALVIVAIMGLLNYSKVYSKTIYIVLGIFFGSLFIKVDYMQPLLV